MFSIVVSKKCAVGLTAKPILMQEFGFKEAEREFDGNKICVSDRFPDFELLTLQEQHIFSTAAEKINSNQVIFASTHSSREGVPSFTVHPIGNPAKALLGGKPKTVVPSSAFVHKKLLSFFNSEVRKTNSSIPVISEVVHHGPFLNSPAVFAEVGSSEKEWADKNKVRILCNTILSFPTVKSAFTPAIGFGGTHYCPEFTKILLRTDIALSYVFSKQAVDSMDFALFKQAIDKSVDGVDFVLMDWKGLNSAHKEKLLPFCKELGLEVRKTRDFLKANSNEKI